MTFKFKDGQEGAREFEFAWRNSGLIPSTGERINVEDAISTSMAGMWMP